MVAMELPSSTIIKGSWQVEERETIESDVYDTLKGAFGMPDCLHSIQGTSRKARSWSNDAWLPHSKQDIPSRFGMWDPKPNQTPLAVLLINEKWTYIPKKSLMRLDKTMDKTDF